MPTVINAYHYSPLSRKRPPLPAGSIYIGRWHKVMGVASALSNPYPLREYGDETIPLYRRWLWDRIQERNTLVMTAFREIKEDSYIVCFCKRPDGTGICHGDTVVKTWEYLRREGLLEV